MALSNAYVLANGRIPEVFAKIRDGQAPDQVTIQLLKDWGFSSSNDRAFLPLLKALGFLTPTGQPTLSDTMTIAITRGLELSWEKRFGEAYYDLFLITANPKEADRDAIKGKFKSFHNASDNTATNLSATFYALLKMADLSDSSKATKAVETLDDEQSDTISPASQLHQRSGTTPSFHYNIQVHLPATKDVEVYNAIFKSLREHFVE